MVLSSTRRILFETTCVGLPFFDPEQPLRGTKPARVRGLRTTVVFAGALTCWRAGVAAAGSAAALAAAGSAAAHDSSHACFARPLRGKSRSGLRRPRFACHTALPPRCCAGTDSSMHAINIQARGKGASLRPTCGAFCRRFSGRTESRRDLDASAIVVFCGELQPADVFGSHRRDPAAMACSGVRWHT